MRKSVKANVLVPGSKSITNRALLLAALANGTSTLRGALVSDDANHFLNCLKALGFEVSVSEEGRNVCLKGCGGRIPNAAAEIYAGSAGTAARFLTAMLGFSDGEYVINASDQMKKRPMRPLLSALEQAGAEVTCLEESGCLPVRIRGLVRCRNEENVCSNEKLAVSRNQRVSERFPDELTVDVDISESTQFLSALLMTAPMLPATLRIRITSKKKDGAYVRITRQMMREFGVETEILPDGYRISAESGYAGKENWQIEPDVSAACYFYAAAAITGSEVTVNGVHPELSQGDLKFLRVLTEMGCTIEDTPAGICLRAPEQLSGICVNMNDFSDQALTLAAIAPFASSPVTIEGIAHIRGQECDRIHAICSNLAKAGILCEELPDGVCIRPGEPHGCEIDTYEDHRVAMAFSLLGLRTEGILIRNPGCCAKTFPAYFQVLEHFKG